MGSCLSSGPPVSPEEQKKVAEERKTNQVIQTQMMQDAKADKSTKLLLLGAGESGKSTLFKQLVTLYGKGYTDADRKEYVQNIYENVIGQMKILVQQTEVLPGLALKNPDSIAAKQFIDEIKLDERVSDEVAKHVTTLWADPLIKNAYEQRALFQLFDSCTYFFDRVNDIAKANYVPNQEDILRIRVRTTGIVETQFQIDKHHFRMFDVGGQRNERKKWIHCFDNVTAVFFVVAISEYDQKLFEDRQTNRISEAMTLFADSVNSPHFPKTPFVVFFNKRDLFAKKIEQVPLTVCYPEYTGKNNFDEASAYIQNKFAQLSTNPDKSIYCHVTCATDQSNVKFVFEAVKDIIINANLIGTGMA